jgi:hypothetical protein
LKNAGLQHVFQDSSVGDTKWTSVLEWRLRRSLQNQFPSLSEAEVQHAVGDWLSRRSGMRGPNGLKLDFNLADIGGCRVCSIERTVCEGGDRPSDRAWAY